GHPDSGSGDIMAWVEEGRESAVIPGRCEASNPESRDSPVRNGTSEVWSYGPSRNDKLFQATLSKNASSAAATASGVPTCIQTPSSRRPNSRSCSLARSNIFVSENSPVGASANSDGDMIAAPA